MVKTYAQLYLDTRKTLMEHEEAQLAAMLARHLICFASGKTHEQFLLDREQYATEAVCRAVENGVRRICDDEPLAYVLGEWSFYGLTLAVDANVLIPRDDTCALAELAIEAAKAYPPDLRVLDLCTGSGCVGLAIASRLNRARVTLCDISADALNVAKHNISRLKLGGRVCALEADVTLPAPPFLGKFHMVVANPPYITTEEMARLPRSVAAYEPHQALHGGADGLDFYRAIVRNYTAALRPGGCMAFEFGEEQGDAICAILAQNGYTVLERVRDFHGTERACIARYDREDD